MRLKWFIFGAAILGANLAIADTNVPRFLTNRSVSEGEARPPETWSATKNVAWKRDLPGLGWASPIVWGDRVFLTTCVSSGKALKPRKGLYIEDLDANKYPPKDKRQYKVYCLDLKSGDVQWERITHEGVPPKPHHIKNTLASETPCTDGERLYVVFGSIGLCCYDLDGELLWEHRITPRETRFGWGTSMSPIVHGERVYYVNDNEEESSIVALNKHTGEVIWTTPRDEQTNYSTPFMWENPVRKEIVVSGINWLKSYDLDGQELWRIKGHSILAIPSPFEHDGLLYVTSGHVLWGENRLFAIKPGASGDITPPSDRREAPDDDGSIQALNKRMKLPIKKDPNEKLDEHLVWYQRMGPYRPTPLIVEDQLYMLLDRGFMASFHAKTGEFMYEKARIPKGRAFTSSPWTYAGKIFCINEDGVTFAITPGDECKVLYTNPLAEDDMCMATPVIVGDRLLIRTSQRVYCIRQTDASTAAASGD
jgi:outer membrane protein assembly factor BamB